MQQPETIEEVREAVLRDAEAQAIGGGSKPALSREATLSLAGLRGVLEYDPGEFTFTALAGTPIRDVQQLLAGHGQYLPFDPPLVEAGATLGGTVAAGLSGPGRHRYGGVRDFLVGVRLVTRNGRLVRGGGKVVKNAAGFDIPKLMVGSLGQHGIVVETTFKVFPMPAASATFAVDLADLEIALDAIRRLAVAPFDLAALDLEPPGRLWLRIAGSEEGLLHRLDRLGHFLDAMGRVRRIDDEARPWRDAREFAWVPPGHGLVKVPLAPRQIVELERRLTTVPAPRRYSAGGNVAWVAWPSSYPGHALDAILHELGQPGLAITGDWPRPRLGPQPGTPFAERLLAAFRAD